MVPKSLLAFVHIEKAAGLTLTHILRRNFFMRHLDVRPLYQESKAVFRSADLRTLLKINPIIRSISGHSVKVFSDLESLIPETKHIVLLRDPIKRYVSHYIYILDWRKKSFPFERFLSNEFYANHQTKAIASCADVEVAKEYLSTRFLVVGVVEEFDEFLIRLKKKLEPMNFDPLYTRQNVAVDKVPRREKTSTHILQKYRDAITDRNYLDLQLFQYLHEKILPKQKEDYGPDLQHDLAEFQAMLKYRKPRMMRSYIDYGVRKLYYEPIIGTVRKLSGMPYSRKGEADEFLSQGGMH